MISNNIKQYCTSPTDKHNETQPPFFSFINVEQFSMILWCSMSFHAIPWYNLGLHCGNCEALEQTCDRRETKRNIWWRNGKAQVGIQSFASYSYVPSHAFSYGDPTLGSLKVGCGPLHWSGRRSLQATPPCRRGTFLIFLSRQTRKEYDSIWEYLLNDIDSWKDS